MRIGPCHARRQEDVVNRTLRFIFSSHHHFGQSLKVVMQNGRDFIKLTCRYTFFEVILCILHTPWLILKCRFTAAIGYVQSVSLD